MESLILRSWDEELVRDADGILQTLHSLVQKLTQISRPSQKSSELHQRTVRKTSSKCVGLVEWKIVEQDFTMALQVDILPICSPLNSSNDSP